MATPRSRREAPADSLDLVRDQVAALRDLELEKAALEQRLDAVNKQINYLSFEALVDLMNEKRVPRLKLAAQGNKPAFEADLQPFYKANIAASWTTNRRNEAFRALEALGAADLIKTAVNFTFGRGERPQAVELFKQHQDLSPKMAETVHAMTLTSWLRERIEQGLVTPPLDLIGGHVGQRVVIKRID